MKVSKNYINFLNSLYKATVVVVVKMVLFNIYQNVSLAGVVTLAALQPVDKKLIAGTFYFDLNNKAFSRPPQSSIRTVI